MTPTTGQSAPTTPQDGKEPPGPVLAPCPPGAGMEPVRFHRRGDPYGAFTCLSRHPVVLQGTVWDTCEHYVQAQKSTDPAHVVRIRNARTPSRAIAMGRSRLVELRPDWDSLRVGVRREALVAKFVQHGRLRHMLLGTGRRPLMYTNGLDGFWGTGDGTGANVLGGLLESIRADLAAHDAGPDWLPDNLHDQPWAAFGTSAVALPSPGRDAIAPRSVRLLRSGHSNTFRIVCLAGPFTRLRFGGAGDVLLHPALGHANDVLSALGAAAFQTITRVHDPRLPLPEGRAPSASALMPESTVRSGTSGRVPL